MKPAPRWMMILGLMGLGLWTARGEGRPNVVLIVCDDLNDYITGIPGEAGHPQAITPHMEKFAASGVAFRRAYSNNPVCAPSRSSFLTGIYPHTSGNLFWAKWFENDVLKNSNTLMEHFAANGYHVAGTGKLMHHHKREVWSEFKHPADYGPFVWDGKERIAHPDVPKPFGDIGAVDGSYGPLEAVPFADDGNPETGWIYGTWGKVIPLNYRSPNDHDPTPDERNAAWAADRIRRFADEPGDQPFFLAVGFLRPHTPLHVPKRYFDMYPLDTIELPVIQPDDAEDTHYRVVLDPDQKGLRYYRLLKASYPDVETGLKTFAQAYLACVTAVDECIGQVVDAIDDSRLKDNTIIVVTSDHGWQMGQKDYLFKNSPWEESTRVPFVVRAPGVARPGGVAEHPISLIDLFPTLVDLCGLDTETRKNEQGAALDGHSVRPFLENPASRTWDGPDAALSMIYVGESRISYSAEEREQLHRQHWTVRTERWRYIRYGDGSEELYDHDADPREWTNLAGSPEHAEIKKSLDATLSAMIEPRPVAPMAAPGASSSTPWDWFRALDRNQDGKVTEGEWLAWSEKSQARKGKPYREDEFKKRFANRDADGDGFLTQTELGE